MLYFPDATSAVVAALDIMDAIEREGLPAGHAGIHAGPVLFQEGDYFGGTVNTAARIADQATRGQVVVSQAVVAAADSTKVTFEPVGPVELKGLGSPVHLSRAARPVD